MIADFAAASGGDFMAAVANAHYTRFLQRDDDGTAYVLPIGRNEDAGTGPWVLATADPPDHGRHRRVLQPHLTATAVDELMPTMRSFAEESSRSGS